ncbi:hypothetical protein KIN20_027271 [Parelaphostrongylus tenuis]|uniref:Saposin B-type domain-containing protein n=1 Tax=Parelaphostrongylus tenuis TaxID=148309 RepID=A0AAD5QZI7_PARTN|nr:hypothetical protein KIN20_027271 [Parelaphostrongylus tenuis]
MNEQMWFFCLLTVAVSVRSTPTPYDGIPVECAACQLVSIAMTKATNQSEGSSNGVNSPMEFCAKLSYCQTTLTHCDIVKSLTSAHSTNITSGMLPKAKQLHSHLQKLLEHCEREPLAEVLADKPGPALCTICILVYDFFKFLNDDIPKMPFIKRIPTTVAAVCFLITFKEHIDPPVCQALLNTGAMPALLQAIADSMGSFYDLIAVQTMGCPSYETLFAICS